MNSNALRILAAFLLVFVVAACGGGERGDTAGDTTTDTAGAGDEIVIQPVGNEMRYEQTAFTVEAGQEVTIVFENSATSPAMQHNVVVLNSDDDEVVNRVGQAALQAGEAADYIPEDEAIIAHTPLSQPGETVRVTFTAPSQPGTYRYICTFPGHFMLMQGTMTVS